MNKRAYLPDFSEAFELDDATESFLDDYKLRNDIEVVSKDEYGEEYAVLKPEVQKELAKTMTTFYELETHSELDDTAKAIEEEVLKALKPISPDVDVEVTWDQNSGLGYIGMTVYVSLGDENEEFEPAGLFYEDDSTMHYAAQDWNWAAWLGIDDSPFYDNAWKEAYILDDANRYFGEVELHEINDMEGVVEDWVEDMENEG